MAKWEYARFYWAGTGNGQKRWVSFTHRDPWEPIKGDEYATTMRRLGEEEFELVAAINWSDHAANYSGEQLYFKRALDQ